MAYPVAHASACSGELQFGVKQAPLTTGAA
jgi:hypothetical protein